MRDLLREVRRYARNGSVSILLGNGASMEVPPDSLDRTINSVVDDLALAIVVVETRRGSTREVRGYYVFRDGGEVVVERVPIEELVAMELYRNGKIRAPRRGVRYCVKSRCISWRDIRREDVEIYVNYLRNIAVV